MEAQCCLWRSGLSGNVKESCGVGAHAAVAGVVILAICSVQFFISCSLAVPALPGLCCAIG